MTQHSAYHYTCDSVECNSISPHTDNSYALPDKWTTVSTWKAGSVSNGVRHLCPGCTEALDEMIAGTRAVKLEEDYFK